MNTLGGMGLWDEEDGFYYDQLHVDGLHIPLKVRSMVGLIPLFAVEILEEDVIAKLPGFRRRMQWFLENRPDLARNISYMACSADAGESHRLLAIPSRERLERVLRYLLDESGVPLALRRPRALARPQGQAVRLPRRGARSTGSTTTRASPRPGLFGGNSNWRGPIWFPVNYLLVEALQRYHHFYGDALKVECPIGSGRMHEPRPGLARDRAAARVALPAGRAGGRRPCHGGGRAVRERSRTGATSSSSTSTSTATPGAASARATRPDGRRSWCAASRTWPRSAGAAPGSRPAPRRDATAFADAAPRGRPAGAVSCDRIRHELRGGGSARFPRRDAAGGREAPRARAAVPLVERAAPLRPDRDRALDLLGRARLPARAETG